MPVLRSFIEQAMARQDLSRDDTARAFQIIMNGGATPAEIAALLVALRMKGESVSEITGAAEVMRAKAVKVAAPAVAIDVCGTGGDASGSVNISTAVALVVAGCGIPVAKHGNRSISSKSGSADVLTALGVNLHVTKETVSLCLQEAGIGFIMAPNFHRAMRHVGPVRTELGIRTLFNLLGPLSNPADTKRQLIGVYSREWVEPLAHVLRELGTEAAWIVHGADGMDELTTTAETYVAELKDGEINTFTVTPEDAGLSYCEADKLKGGDAHQNARAMMDMLSGAQNAYRDIVLLNSAAALMVAGKADNLKDGVALAASSIESGKAKAALAILVRISNEDRTSEEGAI